EGARARRRCLSQRAGRSSFLAPPPASSIATHRGRRAVGGVLAAFWRRFVGAGISSPLSRPLRRVIAVATGSPRPDDDPADFLREPRSHRAARRWSRAFWLRRPITAAPDHCAARSLRRSITAPPWHASRAWLF